MRRIHVRGYQMATGEASQFSSLQRVQDHTSSLWLLARHALNISEASNTGGRVGYELVASQVLRSEHDGFHLMFRTTQQTICDSQRMPES